MTNYEVIKNRNGVYTLIKRELIEDKAAFFGINASDVEDQHVIINDMYRIELYHRAEEQMIISNNYTVPFIFAGISKDDNTNRYMGYSCIANIGTSVMSIYRSIKTDIEKILLVLSYPYDTEYGIIDIRNRNVLAVNISALEKGNKTRVVSIKENDENQIYLMMQDNNIVEPSSGKIIYKDYKGEYEIV